jgi:transposase-like protein
MRYTTEQRAHAVNLYTKHGSTKAARETGISRRSIIRWATAAGALAQGDPQKTAAARAVAAERITQDWVDYRSREATSAGAAAARLRRGVIAASDADDARLLSARAVAYGIMIDKAEKLSNQASERIEVWAESEVDRELRAAIDELESKLAE